MMGQPEGHAAFLRFPDFWRYLAKDAEAVWQAVLLGRADSAIVDSVNVTATTRKRKPTRSKTHAAGRHGRLYTLEVRLTDGPLSEAFVEQNPVVSRTIQIAGYQTLERLHHAIFAAFDREEEHLYEFQVGGKRPHDPKARRYGLRLRGVDRIFDGSNEAASVKRTQIDALGLRTNQTLAYWFDFGDDWWHRIKVVGIENSLPKGRFPRVTQRIGESPPQYPDFDEDDGELWGV